MVVIFSKNTSAKIQHFIQNRPKMSAPALFLKKYVEKFGGTKKKFYLCTRNHRGVEQW
jgi:hypothetical protein